MAVKHDTPGGVTGACKAKAKLRAFAAHGDPNDLLGQQMRPQNTHAQVNLSQIWDFADDKLKTTTWQGKLQTATKPSVQQMIEIGSLADDVHSLVWQDNSPFRADMHKTRKLLLLCMGTTGQTLGL